MAASDSSASAAEQQAALRRVAVLVASGAPAGDVFAAIAEEVAALLRPRMVQIFRWEPGPAVTVVGTWSDGPNPFPAGSVWPWEDPSLDPVMERLGAGLPVRVDSVETTLAGELADAGLSAGVGSAFGAPVMVEGKAWGHISVEMAGGHPLPDLIEERLADFTALVATAISSTETRDRLTRLADEQAALRRVAELVAEGAPPDRVFDTIAAEIGRLLDASAAGLVRFDGEDAATVVAVWGRLGETLSAGTRLRLGGLNAITQIARTGRAARVDEVGQRGEGDIGEHARRANSMTSVGAPIFVAGRLYGAVVASSLDDVTMPSDSGPRMAQFAELMATAISNSEARLELARIAAEQAALRRVATLVAEEAPADVVLDKVAEEVAGVFGRRIDTAIIRFEPDTAGTVVAVHGDQPEGGIVVGTRMPIDGDGVTAKVYRQRRPVRVDDHAAATGTIAEHAQVHGIRSAIGCPILVQGRAWGAMVVAHYEDLPFDPNAERRVSQFTELVATAIANAEARADLERLAGDQAALRRVATLVAKAAPTEQLFQAVIVEVAQLLGAAYTGMMRVDSPTEGTFVAAHGHENPEPVRPGTRIRLEGDSVSMRVLRTGRSARLDLSSEGHGAVAEVVRSTGAGSSVGAPIWIENRLWGVIAASWRPGEDVSADAEGRLAQFAELIATAIANANSRDELTASRARVIAAGDEARRRVVRDLHDGAQQRLVHAIVTLKLAQQSMGQDPALAEELVAEALEQAELGNDELRELAHGVMPAALARGGLSEGVGMLVARHPMPIEADVADERVAPDLEASAYFIVAEALTNVGKHAGATRADVRVRVADGTLHVEVRDDGIGGADPTGHGLLGLADRVSALGGRLRIESPAGGGTRLSAELPLPE